jgi:phi LC3 family holin
MVGKILAVVDAVFALLVILGIAVDPTTAGVGDSKRALGYEKPFKDEIPVPKEEAME